MTNAQACHVKQSPIPGVGRALYAARDIPAGTAALSLERPLVTALDGSQLHATCAECFRWSVESTVADRGSGSSEAETTVKACTGCHTLRYCSKRCQAASWKRGHKKWCPLLARLGQKGTLPNAARAVLDMMLLIPVHAQQDSPFAGMRSERDKILAAGGKPAEKLTVLATGLHTYYGTKLSMETVQNLLALVFTNSLTLYTSTFDALGLALDPLAAAANHDCDANCAVVFDGPKLEYRALRDLRQGDEISISYIDGKDPVWRRRGLLQERYYFHCRCRKCLAEEDEIWNENDKETANYGFYVLERVGKQQRDELLPQLSRALSLCLSTPDWPQTRQPVPSLHQEIFTSLLFAGKWPAAFKSGLHLYFELHPQVYPPPWHPTRVVHKWTLACLALQLAHDPSDADAVSLVDGSLSDAASFWAAVVLGLLTEVQDNVTRSHGVDSAFAATVRRKLQQVRTDMTRGSSLPQAGPSVDRVWARLRELGRDAAGG